MSGLPSIFAGSVIIFIVIHVYSHIACYNMMKYILNRAARFLNDDNCSNVKYVYSKAINCVFSMICTWHSNAVSDYLKSTDVLDSSFILEPLPKFPHIFPTQYTAALSFIETQK